MNYELVRGVPSPLDLRNLNALNALDGANGKNVYLTSKADITSTPEPRWLQGDVPDGSGKTLNATSCAVIVVDKADGIVDTFYMYFYAYNWGTIVNIINQNLGNHVGDWEHNMIRFKDGKPQHIWYSQHAFGQAFTYEVVHKTGLRPWSFSANGSHANYATEGKHDHTIPSFEMPGGNGVLVDHCEKVNMDNKHGYSHFDRCRLTERPGTDLGSDRECLLLHLQCHDQDVLSLRQPDSGRMAQLQRSMG